MIKNINQYDNAILITHNDLDGAVCEILAKKAVNIEETHVCDYKDVNETVRRILSTEKEQRRYRPIIITDISVDLETAKLLESYYRLYTSVLLIDHHKTAIFLNQYLWAVVDINYSASMLVYETFKNVLPEFIQLTTLANDYDLWVHKYPESKQLNTLFSNIPRSIFIDRFLNNSDTSFIDEEKFLIDTINYQNNKYIKKMASKIRIFDDEIKDKHYKIGMVIADRNINDLAELMLQENEEIDIALLLNLTNEAVSIRSRKDVDCSEYAEFFGGGGHAQAAGFPLKHIEDLMYLLSVYYEGEK